MTIKQLVEMCDNVNEKTYLMFYDSVEDYESDSPNWRGCYLEELGECERLVKRFRISKNFNYIAIALD